MSLAVIGCLDVAEHFQRFLDLCPQNPGRFAGPQISRLTASGLRNAAAGQRNHCQCADALQLACQPAQMVGNVQKRRHAGAGRAPLDRAHALAIAQLD